MNARIGFVDQGWEDKAQQCTLAELNLGPGDRASSINSSALRCTNAPRHRPSVRPFMWPPPKLRLDESTTHHHIRSTPHSNATPRNQYSDQDEDLWLDNHFGFYRPNVRSASPSNNNNSWSLLAMDADCGNGQCIEWLCRGRSKGQMRR